MNKNKESKPVIIAVETSGRRGSAALAEGSRLLKEIPFSSAMRHSAELLAVIEKMLNDFGKKPEQIEQIYISAGPGSFTGLRIAVAFAKAMFLANQCKIIAVNTLNVIAANIEELGKYNKIGTILDAKRGQFFAAAYELENTNKYKKTLDDCLITAEEFIEKCAGPQQPLWLLGEGLVYYRDNFKVDGINILDEQHWWPKASKVYQLGWEKTQNNLFEDAYSLQPLYLRQPQLGKSPLQQE